MSTKNQTKEIPVAKIELQTRFERINYKHDKNEYSIGITELAQSIDSVGLLQPIIVFQKSAKPEKYILLAGERRFRAVSEVLKRKTIEAKIIPSDDPFVTISENIQRQDLTAFERGHWVALAVNIVKEQNPDLKQEQIYTQLSIKLGKAPRTLHHWESIATKSTKEEQHNMKTGKSTATEVGKNIQKRGKARKQNKGQKVKKTAKAFVTNSKKLTEHMSFIGSNPSEYKENQEVRQTFEMLKQFIDKVYNKLEWK